MGKKRKPVAEEIPLMMENQSKTPAITYWDAEVPDEEATELDDPEWLQTVANPKKNPNGLMFLATDAVLLVTQYLQLFGLIQSLSLHWTWPEEWLQYGKYLFLLNADIWEFLKLYTSGIFQYAKNYYVPSADMPVDYAHLMSAWAALLIILALVVVSCYSALSQALGPKMFFRLAALKKAFVFILQLLLIPVGTFLFRLLHCTADGDVDVKNELVCYRDLHWAYLACAFVVFVILYIIFPSWLIIRTREELLNAKHETHEIHLQLMETEYLYGINISWVVGNYFIFASFKKSAVHFRAAQIILFTVILILYGAMLSHLFAQSLVINCVLFIILIALCVIRPYRVTAYNVMLIINYVCLNLNCLTGSFKTSFDSSNDSPWLLPEYQFIILATVNGFWLFSVIIFIWYLIIKTCCCQKKLQPVWPQTKFERLSPETRKYMKHIIIGRLLIEKVLSMPAMFAPIHQVARYIHIINAYCREAELIHDPLRIALWNVLDELIEVHTNIAPKCLFAESTKDSIRTTAADLMRIMPSFVRRLAQREYDFILVNPVKRRILLKLYCLSHFLRHVRIGEDRRQLTVPATQKIWHKQSDEDSDPGYFEDIYPPKEPIIEDRIYEKSDDVLIQLDDNESDSSFIIEDTEIWLKKHGLSSIVKEDHLPGEVGANEEDSDSPVSNSILLRDFTIPGLTYKEDSFLREEDERKNANSQSEVTGYDGALRPESSMSIKSKSSVAVTPRSGSRQSMHTPVNTRQHSGMQRSLGSRPTSATPVDLLSVDESLPGAISTEEPINTSKPSLGEGDGTLPRPTSSQEKSIRPGSSEQRSGSSAEKPNSEVQSDLINAEEPVRHSTEPETIPENVDADISEDEDILV